MPADLPTPEPVWWRLTAREFAHQQTLAIRQHATAELRRSGGQAWAFQLSDRLGGIDPRLLFIALRDCEDIAHTVDRGPRRDGRIIDNALLYLLCHP